MRGVYNNQRKQHERTSERIKKKQTDAETKLWNVLRSNNFQGLKFRRQHCIPPYIVDFVCLKKKLIIELDGGQHLLQIDYDFKRTCFLNAKGFKVLRFWNTEIFQNFEGVLETIYEALTLSLSQLHEDAIRRGDSLEGTAENITQALAESRIPVTARLVGQ